MLSYQVKEYQGVVTYWHVLFQGLQLQINQLFHTWWSILKNVILHELIIIASVLSSIQASMFLFQLLILLFNLCGLLQSFLLFFLRCFLLCFLFFLVGFSLFLLLSKHFFFGINWIFTRTSHLFSFQFKFLSCLEGSKSHGSIIVF